MAHRIANTQLGVFLWWMELDREATIALVTGGGKEKAYALLHENGSLMHDQNGPIVADTWAGICEQARVNSSIWILVFHDRRIVRIAFGKNAAYVDSNAVLVVANKEALATLTGNESQEQQDEEAADTANKARRKRRAR
jgi:hypothetical protein